MPKALSQIRTVVSLMLSLILPHRSPPHPASPHHPSTSLSIYLLVCRPNLPTPPTCHTSTPHSSALLLTYLLIHQSAHPSAHLSLHPVPALHPPTSSRSSSHQTHSYPPNPSAYPSTLPLAYPQPPPPPPSQLPTPSSSTCLCTNPPVTLRIHLPTLSSTGYPGPPVGQALFSVLRTRGVRCVRQTGRHCLPRRGGLSISAF